MPPSKGEAKHSDFYGTGYPRWTVGRHSTIGFVCATQLMLSIAKKRALQPKRSLAHRHDGVDLDQYFQEPTKVENY